MNNELYFGASDQMQNINLIERIVSDKPNGFVIGQSGKGYGFHTDTQPSGMALTARQETENTLQSVSETVIIIDPESEDLYEYRVEDL